MSKKIILSAVGGVLLAVGICAAILRNEFVGFNNSQTKDKYFAKNRAV